jgi:TPR repeat protein
MFHSDVKGLSASTTAADEAAANAGHTAAMFDLGLLYENSKHRRLP